MYYGEFENSQLNIEVEKNENSGVTRRKFEIIEWYLRSTQGSRPHVIYASLRVLKSQNIIIKKYTFGRINGALRTQI